LQLKYFFKNCTAVKRKRTALVCAGTAVMFCVLLFFCRGGAVPCLLPDSDGRQAEKEDTCLLPPETEETDGNAEVVPAGACGSKQKVLNYLRGIYGTQILAGQHTSPNMEELQAVYRVTGKKPALLEFDFMDCSPSRIERGAEKIDLEPVISWWNQGGLVAFCWHWNAPCGLIDEEPDKQWYRGFYTDCTTFDLEKAMEETQSKEYRLLLRDIDAIAAELKKLRDAGVPVLWRPLHEASGGWFWWGSRGTETYLKLWKLMYDRLTNYHGLDNLIWVWNGEDPDWYPGDDTVDIVGMDHYGEKHDYSPGIEEYQTVLSWQHDKMIALTETGVVPDPDLLEETSAKWLWYSTWSDNLVLNEDRTSYSGEYTERRMLKKAYNHAYVVTLDELPGFR